VFVINVWFGVCYSWCIFINLTLNPLHLGVCLCIVVHIIYRNPPSMASYLCLTPQRTIFHEKPQLFS